MQQVLRLMFKYSARTLLVKNRLARSDSKQISIFSNLRLDCFLRNNFSSTKLSLIENSHDFDIEKKTTLTV